MADRLFIYVIILTMGELKWVTQTRYLNQVLAKQKNTAKARIQSV